MTEYENPQWAIPCARFIDYLVKVIELTDLTQRGINVLTMAPRIVDTLMSTAKPGDDTERYEKQLKNAKQTASLAEYEINNDFPILHSHALMGAWGALEGMIEDLAVSRIQHDSSVLDGPRVAKIRVPLIEFQKMSDHDRTRFLVTELQRELGLELKSGATKFEPLLALLGIGGTVDGRVRDVIFEAQNLRNVFAHRGGVADRKFVTNCPRLQYKVGDTVKIGREEFYRIFYGLLTYGAIILNRCRTIEGMHLFDLDFPGFEGAMPASDMGEGI